MKTARKSVTSVELQCPECGETIPALNGSLFWTVAEVPLTGSLLTCQNCGKQSKVPRV